MSNAANYQWKQRRRDRLLASALALALVWSYLQWRQCSSLRDTLDTAAARLRQMQTDAVAIQTLREAPKRATDRVRSSQELLGIVEQSLAAATIDRAQWQDSVPQPLRQIPSTPFRKATTKLYLDRLTMRQLAELTFDLQRRDPTLAVSGIDLGASGTDNGQYNVELVVSYLIFMPG